MHFLQHLEPDALAQVYGVSDVFVLPSFEETWGLVVNEAMACGLPVITTDRVGAAVDLVREGENGFVVPGWRCRRRSPNDSPACLTIRRCWPGSDSARHG